MKPLPYATAVLVNPERREAVVASFHVLVHCVCGGMLNECPALTAAAA